MIIEHTYTVSLLTNKCLMPPHGPSSILSLTAQQMYHRAFVKYE